MAAQAQIEGTLAVDRAEPSSDARLTISGDTIAFHESTCTLANPVAVRGMAGATLYDVTCTGEGETWTDRTLLMPGADGALVRLVQGHAFTYARCA